MGESVFSLAAKVEREAGIGPGGAPKVGRICMHLPTKLRCAGGLMLFTKDSHFLIRDRNLLRAGNPELGRSLDHHKGGNCGRRLRSI